MNESILFSLSFALSCALMQYGPENHGQLAKSSFEA
jgi:hypothetical protein